jgi:hypothetical protein
MEDELGLCPKFTSKDCHTSLPSSCSHNRPTSHRNKPRLKAARKRNSRSKRLRQSVKPGRTICMDWADLPRGSSRLSAGTPRTVRNCHPNLHYCTSKNGLPVPYPRTIHAEETIRTLLTDCPPNSEQPKAPDKMNRNTSTQEHAKNTTNT